MRWGSVLGMGLLLGLSADNFAAADNGAMLSSMRVPQRSLEQPDSVSCGSTNRGGLTDAAKMPSHGPGFVVPDPWRSRGARYATTEMVALLQRAAASVADTYDGSVLGVADLSAEHGGPIASHRSHQNGRDVDLIFYSIDAKGRPLYPDRHMAYFNRKGQATHAKAPVYSKISTRYFDLKRNWALVRALILDPEVQIDHIFVSPRIKRWLLAYAAQIGEPDDVISMAEKELGTPTKVGGHNDHMHVRIGCSQEDIDAGRCRDSSAARPMRGIGRRVRCPAPVSRVRLPKS